MKVEIVYKVGKTDTFTTGLFSTIGSMAKKTTGENFTVILVEISDEEVEAMRRQVSNLPRTTADDAPLKILQLFLSDIAPKNEGFRKDYYLRSVRIIPEVLNPGDDPCGETYIRLSV